LILKKNFLENSRVLLEKPRSPGTEFEPTLYGIGNQQAGFSSAVKPPDSGTIVLSSAAIFDL
jgi:hypothetical protein